MSGRENIRVAVGMSGGVDSSVAAAMLIDRGMQVSGVFIDCWSAVGCRTQKDKEDALKVAMKLGIPFVTLDYKKEYREKVVEYFYNEYKKGLTPNPDVLCNSEIKFGLFYKWAKNEGFEYVATGHYCRVVKASIFSAKTRVLLRGKDGGKDQSYFLYRLKEEQLDSLLFPLGEMMKSEVRRKAKELKLHVANKPDSMGICFIGNVDVAKLLRDRLGEDFGDVILDGEKIGRHRGLWFHTVGQRGGFEVDKKELRKLGYEPEKMEPLYVRGKDVERNELVVGSKEDACRRDFPVSQVHLINKGTDLSAIEEGLYVRVRNLGELVECKVESEAGGLRVWAKEPIFGVAPGQSAVFYWRNAREGEEIVLGGGVIDESGSRE